MAKNKTFDDRKNDEKAEGYDTVETGMPSGRFQDKKQVLTPDELGVAKSSISGTDGAPTTNNLTAKTATAVKSKMKIRPDVSVEELKNKQVGGVPLAVTPGLRSVAGVSSMSPADDQSKIPYTKGDYRPQSRYGKKRSDDLFEIDNTISEQIAPVVDDAKDLKDDPESKQGYNGRKQFTQTRGKKNATFVFGDDQTNGKIPQQLLNDCSLDFIHTDKVVYTSGQMLDDIDTQADYPTMKSGNAAVVDRMSKSNYKPKAFKFTISDGKISSVSIDEDKVEVKADAVTRDQANLNWQVDSNNVAKSMIKLQTELGRETTEKWSPLGYVITEPYEYNMLMHDIEATTGAIMATAYRSAVSSMAFQRNILAKDGVGPQKNAVKMIYEGYAGVLADSTSSTISVTDFNKVIWDKAQYRAGSVAAIIAMFDSVNKYKTKADILGLQRSLSLHLSQADNNINPLHCKANFIKALDKAHMFSTVDGNYNPMLPIFSTHKIKLFNPLSLNQFLIGWKNPATLTADEMTDPMRDIETGTYANYSYTYRDIRNNYNTRVQHPLIEGILRWMLKHEGAIAATYGDGEVTIPFEFNFEAPNMLSFMLCAASQDVLWERNICFRDVIFAGDQMTYIWDDLVGLDKLNPLYSSQLSIGKYDQPLKLGRLASDTAVRELWATHMCLAEVQHGVGVSTTAQYFAPWYMNEVAYGGDYTSNEGFNNEDSAYNMTIPSIRDGVRHEYVDVIKSMSERDIRLSLDRWLRFPLFDTSEQVTSNLDGHTSDVIYTRHYVKESNSKITDLIKASALRYEFNSDGRCVLTYQCEEGVNEHNLNEYSLYGCPKELGFIDDCYDGRSVISEISAEEDHGTWSAVVTATPITATNTYDGCEVYTGYSPIYASSYRVEADSHSSISIDRAAALSQVFYNFFASVDATDFNTKFINKIGIIPCFSYNSAAPVELTGYFTLNGSTESNSVIESKITSVTPLFWSMLQRCFFPVNRFENCYALVEETPSYDPLEASFFFGVCGTLASDYTQDTLERLDIYDQLGLDYTEDVFVKDSLIFR